MSRAPCAACGKPKAFDQFMVDRPECSGLFKLCAACWGEGENNEAWNEAVTQRIIRRRSEGAPLFGTVENIEIDLKSAKPFK